MVDLERMPKILERMSEEERQRVRILIESIKEEIKLGTKHFDRKGELLDTPLKIIMVLMNHGIEGLRIEPSKDREYLFETPSKQINRRRPVIEIKS